MRTRREVPQFDIYVRHSADCPYKDDPEYPRCSCIKHIRWYADGKPHSKSTFETKWAAAENVKARMVIEYGGAPKVKPEISVAIDAFVQSRKDEGLSRGVQGKYKRELERLRVFLEAQRVHRLEDITQVHLMAFRSTWEDLYESATTRSKVQERLKSFFKHCTDVYRLQHNPAKSLKAVKFNTPPTLPLSLDKEYPALLKASNEFRPPMNQRIRALAQLMRWSGLALQDACCFERAALRRDADGNGFIKTRRAKTGVDVEVPIPPEVAEELEALPNSNPKYFFWAGRGAKKTVASRYSEPMKRLFEKAKVDVGGTVMKSHRLRDTFAVDYLTRGFSLEAVAEMLGHSPEITRKHYDHWVKGRQDALNKAIIASWKKAG